MVPDDFFVLALLPQTCWLKFRRIRLLILCSIIDTLFQLGFHDFFLAYVFSTNGHLVSLICQ